MKRVGIIFSFVIFTNLCFSQTPKYIFLCIGDGMGLVQSQLADSYLRAVSNDSVSFLYFPHNGYQTSYSLSSKITCSAAAGTALACGVKTKAGYIGMGPQANDTLESIAYKAKKNGYKVGILSSVSIDHATPAVFYAHDASRNNYHSIAMQLPKSQFDFFGGGSFIKPIEDNKNVYNELKKNNYAVVTSKDSLKFVSQLGKKVCVFDTHSELPYGIDKNETSRFSLAELTKTAIQTLDNPNGFFMMIEGGKIDWACHSNDATTAIYEVIEFNKAIREALDFYVKHPNETVIIVTADHETGGMAIGSALYPYFTDIALLKNQTQSYVNFEKILSDEISRKNSVFTFDTCMRLIQTYYNTESSNGIKFTKFDSVRLLKSYEFVMNPLQIHIDEETRLMYNSSTNAATYAPQNRCMAIVITINTILAEKAGIGWTTFAHTGVNIPVFAIGSGSEKFNGMYDNTDIAKKILSFIQK